MVPILQAPSVHLRPVSEADYRSLLGFEQENGIRMKTTSEVRHHHQKIRAEIQAGQCLHWGICLSGNTTVIGTCGFYRGFHNETGEIGYIISEKYRKKGLMKASLKLILGYGFHKLELRKIIAHVHAHNDDSIFLLKALAFIHTGTLKKAGYPPILVFSKTQEQSENI